MYTLLYCISEYFHRQCSYIMSYQILSLGSHVNSRLRVLVEPSMLQHLSCRWPLAPTESSSLGVVKQVPSANGSRTDWIFKNYQRKQRKRRKRRKRGKRGKRRKRRKEEEEEATQCKNQIQEALRSIEREHQRDALLCIWGNVFPVLRIVIVIR